MKCVSEFARILFHRQQQQRHQLRLTSLSSSRSLLVTCSQDVRSYSWKRRSFAAAVITGTTNQSAIVTGNPIYHCNCNSESERKPFLYHDQSLVKPSNLQERGSLSDPLPWSVFCTLPSFRHSALPHHRQKHPAIVALASTSRSVLKLLNIPGGEHNRCRYISTTTENKTKDSEDKMNQLNQAKNIWRKAEAICFDVDSTVIQDEAIDELAKFCGKGDEVEQLTREAMKGGMDFRQALALRLDLIRPSLQQLRGYILSTKHRLSPYVKELIHELHKRGKEVYLISGGFRSIIIPLAQELHIPTANVYANKLKFYYDGEYAGFDENQLTSRTGGKGAVIRNLKEKHGYETVVMVGDGITDWEASPPADLFIGFGGNEYRQEVKSKSKWYVTDFRDLINELRD